MGMLIHMTRYSILLTVGLLSLAFSANAIDEPDAFVDSTESSQLAPNIDKGNWVVAPIPISNPTLGTGLQLAVLYLHPARGNSDDSPNATTGLGLMYTDTDSWFAGLFHKTYLYDDSLRLMAAAGKGSLQLKYFGSGGGGLLASNPVGYSLDADVGFARAQWRLPGTEHWFLGPAYVYGQGDVTLDFSSLVPTLPAVGKNILISGLGLTLTYDSRDNNYYPTRGADFGISSFYYGDDLGSDFSFSKTTAYLSNYFPVSPKLVVASNAYYETGAGDIPFFMLASPGVRGYDRGRYMDDGALKLSIESRYQFRARWSVVGFYDYGWVSDKADRILSGETAFSIGGGIRWQTTPDKPLNLGLDVAYTGDSDAVVFIQIGERF